MTNLHTEYKNIFELGGGVMQGTQGISNDAMQKSTKLFPESLKLVEPELYEGHCLDPVAVLSISPLNGWEAWTPPSCGDTSIEDTFVLVSESGAEVTNHLELL